MAPRWQDVVQNEAERKVFEALSDPKWDFRTIDGLKKATGLNPDQIETILRKYRNQLVHQTTVPDKFGRDLYALTRAQTDLSEMFLKLRTLVGKKPD